MSKTEFESAIRRLLRRAELLKQVQRGAVELVPVECKGARAHWVKKGRPYTRYIAPPKWQPRAAMRIAA